MEKDNIVFTLDDGNKYVLVEQVNIDNIEYLYLVDINNEQNALFVSKIDNKLKKIVDQLLIGKILYEIGKVNN